MDPVANLKEQLQIARDFIKGADSDSGEFTTYGDEWEPDTTEVLRLAELVLALDEWRKNGGFDPYEYFGQ